MTRGARTTHRIVALKDITQDFISQQHDLLKSRLGDLPADSSLIKRYLGQFDEQNNLVILEGDPQAVTDEGNRGPPEDVFLSFPNINKAIVFPTDPVQQSSTRGEPFCAPIAMDSGHWAWILDLKKGFIFESSTG